MSRGIKTGPTPWVRSWNQRNRDVESIFGENDSGERSRAIMALLFLKAFQKCETVLLFLKQFFFFFFFFFLFVCSTSLLKTLGKVEVAHNEQFLLFSQRFLPFWRFFHHFIELRIVVCQLFKFERA